MVRRDDKELFASALAPSRVLPGKRTSLSPTDGDGGRTGRAEKKGRAEGRRGKNYGERGERGKREVDEPGSVVLIIVSASIVPDRRLQVQPGTRCDAALFENARSSTRGVSKAACGTDAGLRFPSRHPSHPPWRSRSSINRRVIAIVQLARLAVRGAMITR
jgi:hypothetical protein